MMRCGLRCFIAAVAVLPHVVRADASASPTQESDAPAVSLSAIEIRLLEHDRKLPVEYRSALQLAAANHFDILQARARLEEARAARLRAAGRMLPSLSGSLTARHIDGEIQASFGELDRKAFGTINPASIVTLQFNPGQAIFDLLAAHRRVVAGELVEDTATQTALARVAVQYFELLRAQAQVNIANASVATAAEIARLARDRQQLGLGLAVDTARAEARLAREQVSVTAAEERFRNASIALAESLRLEPAVLLFPTEEGIRAETLVDPDRPLDALLADALARQPELRALATESNAAANARTAAWWRALGPELYGTVEESAIGRSFDVNNRQVYGGFAGWTLAPSSLADARMAEARAVQAGLRRDQLAQAVKAEVVRARDAATTAKERLGAAARTVSAAKQSLALSEDRIKGGVGLQLEAIEAQEALVAARTALVESIIDYNVSQVRLLRAIGNVSVAALTGR